MATVQQVPHNVYYPLIGSKKVKPGESYDDVVQLCVDNGWMRDKSISQLRDEAITEQGGCCLTCNHVKCMKVLNSHGFLVEPSDSKDHRLMPDELEVEVFCLASNSLETPMKTCDKYSHISNDP